MKNSIDFIVNDGTAVLAAQDSILVDLKSDSDIGGEEKELEDQGNFIEIEHENKKYSEYEQLKKNGIIVKLGEKVKTEQIIGYTGSTGWIAH